MDRIGKMAAFVKVAESGSFTAAARALRLSPTMVSKHVRELEDQLGIRLLNRTTRRVNLTEVGQCFYDRCAPLLVEIAELESMASALHAAPRGLLRVSAPLAFGAVSVAPHLGDFGKLCPEVTVELILSDRAVDLIEEGFDLAIYPGDLPDSSCLTRLLGRFPTVACASPSYLAERGAPAVPEDLADHNCLALVAPDLPKEWIFRSPAGGVHAVKIAGNLRTNSVSAQLAAALQGQGITLQPSYLVAEELRSGRLVHVLADYATQQIPVHLVYPPGRHLSAKVRSFIDFLVGRFRREG